MAKKKAKKSGLHKEVRGIWGWVVLLLGILAVMSALGILAVMSIAGYHLNYLV